MPARLSLPDFQAELARKLAESSRAGVTADWLAIGWHGARALIPLGQAGEISSPLVCQALPQVQPWVVGVAGMRGGLTVVVDWVRLLALDAVAPVDDPQSTPYWVSMNPALGVQAALCVDRLWGLRSASEFHLEQEGGTEHAAVKGRWRDARGDTWMELDLRVLVQSPDFLDPTAPPFDRVGQRSTDV